MGVYDSNKPSTLDENVTLWPVSEAPVRVQSSASSDGGASQPPPAQTEQTRDNPEIGETTKLRTKCLNRPYQRKQAKLTRPWSLSLSRWRPSRVSDQETTWYCTLWLMIVSIIHENEVEKRKKRYSPCFPPLLAPTPDRDGLTLKFCR